MKTPGLVTAIAVWQFLDGTLAALAVFASVAVTASIMGHFPDLFQSALEQSGQSLPQGFDQNTFNTIIWSGVIVGVVLNLGFTAMAIIGGVGLLRLKKWGRTLGIVHAAFVVFGALSLTLLSLFTASLAGTLVSDLGTGVAAPEVAAIFIAFGFVALIGLGLGLFSLIYLLRGKTAALFKPTPPLPGIMPPAPPTQP